MDLSLLILMVVGLFLVIGSMVALTTFGEKRPVAVLAGIFISFAVYILIILVRIGMIDLSWIHRGGG